MFENVAAIAWHGLALTLRFDFIVHFRPRIRAFDRQVYRQEHIRAMERTYSVFEPHFRNGVSFPVVRISNPLGNFLYKKLRQFCGQEYLQSLTITEPGSTDSLLYGTAHQVLLLLQTFVIVS